MTRYIDSHRLLSQWADWGDTTRKPCRYSLCGCKVMQAPASSLERSSENGRCYVDAPQYLVVGDVSQCYELRSFIFHVRYSSMRLSVVRNASSIACVVNAALYYILKRCCCRLQIQRELRQRQCPSRRKKFHLESHFTASSSGAGDKTSSLSLPHRQPLQRRYLPTTLKSRPLGKMLRRPALP